MARPLSVDLRKRIADALAEGMTVRAAALRFGVSAATAVRIGQLDRSGRGAGQDGWACQTHAVWRGGR